MKRDRRLLFAVFGVIVGLVCFHFYIENALDWSHAYWTADWANYGKKYNINVPPPGTTFDYSAPQQTWLGIAALASFAIAIIVILIAWWKPKQ